ncbi:unnamed protein product [Caenorhabditis auriculariae]|uniref:Uncharacterized protein n=1 Tax=Caenorhabditis auriculariae TaxID=2777116 RepID=A0A8S1H590_9PELO|nr:unnamed protein product [Caenorhabditis auriculariae]
MGKTKNSSILGLSDMHLKIIAGAVAGLLLLIFFCAVIMCCLLTRKKKKPDDSEMSSTASKSRKVKVKEVTPKSSTTKPTEKPEHEKTGYIEFEEVN